MPSYQTGARAKMDNAIILGANIVGKKLGEFKGLEKKELAKKAFELVHDDNNVWYSTSEEDLFKIGLGALLLNLDGEDKHKLEQEIKLLRALTAATSGIPVDLGAVFDSINPDDLIGVLGIFREVRASLGKE